MKRCSACKKDKDLAAFSVKSKRDGTWSHICKPCQSNYAKAHYKGNKAYYIAKAKKNGAAFILRNREKVRTLKNRPCSDCGGRFHFSAMDFDHVRGKKLFGVANRRDVSAARLAAEISKCEVVCANCHRVRTWNRLHAAEARMELAPVFETGNVMGSNPIGGA